MQHHIDSKTYHIEILTPKQNSPTLDEALELFADKYTRTIEAGYVACITDNPMGLLSFQATEVISELELPVEPEQLVIHLNTFHTKEALHEILDTAQSMGAKYLLCISGDGSERLPKLQPEDLGEGNNAVTSAHLIKYIERCYPGVFSMGVAFNPYEPQDHEIKKMEAKMEAGAEYVITQPVLGRDDRLDALDQFGKPVIVDVWMSKKLHLLSECVGYEIPEDTAYDPVQNLKDIQAAYPKHGLYLALCGFKTQFPHLREWWK